MSNLAVHYLRTHGRPEDLALIRRVSSKLVKAVYPGKPDVNGLKAVWDCLDPDGVLVLRNVAMSNQTGDVVKDPIATGHRHAREWLEQIREFPYLDPARVKIESANEVPQWGGVGPETQVMYNCIFADDLNAGGWWASLVQCNTGYPNNTGPDTPSNWKPFDSVLDRLSWAGNWLGLHEYWGLSSGPRGLYAGWWAYRYRHLLDYCKATGRPHPPIVINEMGGLEEEQHPDGSYGLHPARGWFGVISPEQYYQYLCQYAADSAADGIIAATIFTTDGAHPWIDTMDTHHGIHGLWMADGAQELAGIPEDAPPKPKPPKPDPGPVPPGAIDPNVALAVMEVESGGSGFGADGRPVIRFEAHEFKRQLNDDALFAQHFQIAEERPWEAQQWLHMPGGVLQPIHTGRQAPEWAAFERARSLHPDAAMKSIGMGLAQIMGFNHARVGYADVATMFADYSDSTTAQIVGFFNYVLTDPNLVSAVKAKDWREIAKLYNGPGSVDVYAPRLEAAYLRRAFAGLPSATGVIIAPGIG